MTPDQIAEIRRLHDLDRSTYYISACVDGVSWREIEELVGSAPHPADRMSPALRKWWMQQSWVWRPDNQTPIEAPWERLVK
jgi:hypothetical protein